MKLSSFFSFLWQQHGLNVGQHTTLGNGHTTQQFVQFLIVTDGQLKVTRNDTGFLVITGCITGQFQNFCGQIFKNGSKIDWSTSANTFSVIAFTQQTMDTTNRKLKTSSG
ncbi:hypothetical protein DERF_011582 [Dermatophagoides farinae]|uniref:Uncharacterized protein n=1 Tax=Dermatophagoides farinae TaxID=6954 RepID=A0A922HVP8_DERFA|nr:hypothetical protein DERF_011582 [Dermatophagoides farinae]